MPDPLAQFRKAVAAKARVDERKRLADQRYREALHRAHEAGVSQVELAKAAGVTKQAISKMLRTTR